MTKKANIRITGVPEGKKKKKREKGAESLFKEIIAENFPHHGQNWNIQVHEANRTGISMQKDHFLDTL